MKFNTVKRRKSGFYGNSLFVFSHFLFLTLLLFSLVLNSAWAANERLGKTILARGSIMADRGAKQDALKRLSPVFRQDTLRSGNNARAQFRMVDNALINLQQNSVLKLRKYALKSANGDGNVLLELISGGLRTITGSIGKQNKKDYQLRTPIATIGIRGTMYEVEMMLNGGMYVGTWQGAISVRSHSGNCNITLGDGFEDRFVFVNAQGFCKVLKRIPKVFREGHSSKASRYSVPYDYEVEPLLDNPRQEQPFQALTVGQGNIAIATGRTNSIERSTTVISTENNGDVTTDIGSVSSFSQNIGGYPVGWGRWNSYSASPISGGVLTPASDENGLLWSTYQATNSDVVESRIGEVRYDSVVDGLAQSSMGAVSNIAVQMDVDFTSGQISNGAISAQVPDYTWVGVFDGKVTDGELGLSFNGGSLVNANSGISSHVSGNIQGDFVGNNAEGITGGFNMIDNANNNNQIEGLFLIEEK